MDFTAEELANLKKATHLLDNGWQAVHDAPNPVTYSLSMPKDVIVHGNFANLTFDDAVKVQECIEKLAGTP